MCAKLNEKATLDPVHGECNLEKQIMIVAAASAGFEAGNFARITIDGQMVNMTNNAQGNDRGLHIVVISQPHGKIESA